MSVGIRIQKQGK